MTPPTTPAMRNLPQLTIEEKNRRLVGWCEQSTSSLLIQTTLDAGAMGDKSSVSPMRRSGHHRSRRAAQPYRNNNASNAQMTPPHSPAHDSARRSSVPCLHLEQMTSPIPRGTTTQHMTFVKPPMQSPISPIATHLTRHAQLRQPATVQYQVSMTLGNVANLEDRLNRPRHIEETDVDKMPMTASMPDDLASVDTTAFECLMRQPMTIDTKYG